MRRRRYGRLTKSQDRRQAVVMILLLVVVIGGAFLLILFAILNIPGTKIDPTSYASVAGIGLATLGEPDRQKALKLMNTTACPCGCRMTLAHCRHKHTSCKRSLEVARSLLKRIEATAHK